MFRLILRKPQVLCVLACLLQSLMLPVAFAGPSGDNSGNDSSGSAASAVPNQIHFGGTLKGLTMGPVGATFSLYADATGGTALWMERQNIAVDANGNYTVLLGAETPGGVPQNIFASGAARWLEVSDVAGVDGTVLAEPRVLLVSVPYALKAGDSETLGGLPASAFALKVSTRGAGEKNDSKALYDALPSAAATVDRVPKFVDGSGTLGDSVIVETGGNVGVGTLAPGAKMHVVGTSGNAALFDSTGSNDLFAFARNGVRRGVLGASPAGDLFLFQDQSNSFPLSIDPTGKLGVGTTSPTARLHVVADSGNSAVFDNSGSNDLFAFARNGVRRGVLGASPAGDLFMFQDQSNSFPLFIDPTGKLGVGTTSPTARLHVVADSGNSAVFDNSGSNDLFAFARNGVRRGVFGANSAGDLYMFQDQSSSFPWYIDATGRMGVGTVTPSAKLDVSGSLKASGFTLTGNNAGNGKVLTSDANGTATWQTPTGGVSGTGTTNKIAKFTAASTMGDSLLFDNGTNIGVGTITPGVKLEVAGNIKSSSGGFVFPDATTQTTAASSNVNIRGINYLTGCDTCTVLADSDDQQDFWVNQIGSMTIQSITCFSDLGSPTIDIRRDNVTGGTNASVLTGATMTCVQATSGGGGTTVSGGSLTNNTLGVNDRLDFVINSAGGVAHRITLVVKALVN